MSVQYFFDSSGNWIAFRKDRYVFDRQGSWIGWLPWDDADVVDIHGQYLGTIFPGDRFYKITGRPYRGYPGYPGFPGYPGYPGYPGFAGYSPRPVGTEEVELSERV
jgi:4-fold beta flower protein